jgi:hypothetical protein
VTWAYLAIGGFLVGSLFYSASYTLRFEPQARTAYGVIGAGLAVSVVVNAWLDLDRDVSDWYRVGTLAAYALVAVGLVLLTRARRRVHELPPGQWPRE